MMDRQTYVKTYLPPVAQVVRAKDCDAEFYLYNGTRGPAAAAFVGKARKPTWRFYFSDAEQREKRIRSTIESARATAKTRAENAAERSKPRELKCGDILYTSWGYDQTNIDFYEVMAVKGSFVELQQLQQETSETRYMAGETKPILGSYKGDRIRRKVTYGKSVRIESYAHASQWDGKPKSCSWYA